MIGRGGGDSVDNDMQGFFESGLLKMNTVSTQFMFMFLGCGRFLPFHEACGKLIHKRLLTTLLIHSCESLVISILTIYSNPND